MRSWAAALSRFASTHRVKRSARRSCAWKSMPILNASREGRVLKLVLNRPEKRNALNGRLCRELVAAIEDAGQDDGVGAILLSGAGAAFCAGMDLDEMLTPEAASLAEAHERLFSIGRRLTVPLI